MKSKFQFKTVSGIKSFERVESFKTFCNARYKECIKSNLLNKNEFHYSTNFGQSWTPLKNYSDDSIDSSSEFTFSNLLFWCIAVWLLLSIIDSKFYKIDFVSKNNIKLTTLVKNQISNWSKSDKVPTYSDYKNNQNSSDLPMPTETAKPSNFNQCSSCNGTGFKWGCNDSRCRNGYVHCDYCNGMGYENSGKVCLKCRGEGTVFCGSCNGDPASNKITCSTCYGNGNTIFKTCPQCKGHVLSEGDSGYFESDRGTNCLFCGGNGKVEEDLEGEEEKYRKSQLKELLENIQGGS